jgi:hypothetical protein
MKVRLRNIAPLQAGKMSAAVYGLMSLIVCPFIILAALFAPRASGFPIILAILLPVIYTVLGFVLGVIGAFIYNLIARWLGGVEMTFEETA